MSKFISVFFIFCVLATFDAEAKRGGNRNKCSCHTNRVRWPVCGSDGRTYASPRHLMCYKKCNNDTIEIRASQPCLCVCPTEPQRQPVCGSDGQSYVNPSAVDCHNICNYPPITIKGDSGPCHEGDELLRN